MPPPRLRLVAYADLLLAFAAILLLLLSALLVFRHGWSARYGVITSVGILCLLVRRLSPPTRINLTLLLIASVSALSLANLFLGFRAHMDRVFPRSHWLDVIAGAEHVPVLAQAAQRAGAPFDRRTRIDLIRDLSRDGTDVWPAMSAPLFFESSPSHDLEPIIHVHGAPLVPLGGIADTQTVFCNETGQYTVYHSGAHGFANPPDLWSRDQIAIAVVGDSFAQGACVSYEESFPSVIRRQFPETLNLGNFGIGPLAELAIMKEYLPAVRPQTVLWTYFEHNDFSDLRREQHSLLIRYLDPSFSQDLIHRQAEIDQALKSYVREVLNGGSWPNTGHALVHGARELLFNLAEWENLVKLSFLWEAGEKFLAQQDQSSPVDESAKGWVPQPAATDEELALFRHALGEAQALVRSWGGQFVFVYLPEYERFARPEFVNVDRQPVLDIVSDLAVPLVDIQHTFEQHPDVLSLFPFRQPAHYSAEGYRLVAEAILSHLDP